MPGCPLRRRPAVTRHDGVAVRRRPLTSGAPDAPVPGHLAVHVDVERSPGVDGLLDVAVHVDGLVVTARVPAGETAVVVDADLPQVRRWWPRGYGDQPLYEVTVELLAVPGTTPGETEATEKHRPRAAVGALDVRRHRVGFRTVRLDMLPDEHDGEPGTSFAIVVNDQPVFVRGANWIPDDAFPHRVTRERYAARIAQAEQANVNLLRVWGGGIFEADDFYDLCDERGILTWQ
ncbi:MAG: glycoside hydrolase family 2 protein, partial [Oerskovia sp.]|nr:glycoside hydrolase family 2 protein [Oerskovia sp.]